MATFVSSMVPLGNAYAVAWRRMATAALAGKDLGFSEALKKNVAAVKAVSSNSILLHKNMVTQLYPSLDDVDGVDDDVSGEKTHVC
jgi:hypothetical protein